MSKVDESPKIRPFESGGIATQVLSQANPEQITKHEAASRAQQGIGLKACGEPTPACVEAPLSAALSAAAVAKVALSSAVDQLEEKLGPVCVAMTSEESASPNEPEEPHCVAVSLLRNHIQCLRDVTSRIYDLQSRLEV